MNGGDDFWKKLFESSTQSREETLKGLADTLRLVHELKQSVPYSAPPPGSNVLFQLAGLQMDTAKKVAEISAEYTKSVGNALRERRAAASGPGGRPAQVLVSPSIAKSSPVNETFKIRNESSAPRTFALPAVLQFERPGTWGRVSTEGVFVNVKFEGAATAAEETCPLPYAVTVPGLQSAEVTLTIAWDERFDVGRYRAVVPLVAEGCPPAELIVELLVHN